MKNILLKSALVLFLALTSCSKDEDVPKVTHQENIVCDTGSNLININSGGWVQNSNGDTSNWLFYQSRGFQLFPDELLVTIRNTGGTITHAELVGISSDLYDTKYKTADTVLFKFTNNLIVTGDVVSVNLSIEN